MHVPLELYVAFDDCFHILYCFTLTLTLFGEHCSLFSCVHICIDSFFLGNALCMEQEEVGGRERKEHITCQKKNCAIQKTVILTNTTMLVLWMMSFKMK